MSEAPDPLEAELSYLQPREVSSGLRRHLAERLVEAPQVKSRLIWRFAFAGGLAAACLAALFWWGREPSKPDPGRVPFPSNPPIESAEATPSLQKYQRALARSPEELDNSLNQDALVSLEPNPEPVRAGSFSQADAALHALLGDD